VISLLSNADFPGNIRELENEVERAVTLADNNSVFTPELLSDRFKLQKTDQTSTEIGDLGLQQHVDKLEVRLIENALHETKGNILKAAKILKLSRAGLHKKINRYHIIPKDM
jgi:transcriptional regulator with PAS, ATPase and Fis domain